jgi:hypothetical protein
MFATHRPREVPQVCALWQHPAVNSSHTALTTLPHPPAGAQALVLPGAVGDCLCSHATFRGSACRHMFAPAPPNSQGLQAPSSTLNAAFRDTRAGHHMPRGRQALGTQAHASPLACPPPTLTPHSHQPPLLRHSPCRRGHCLILMQPQLGQLGQRAGEQAGPTTHSRRALPLRQRPLQAS